MNKEELKKACQEYADKKDFLLQPDEGILDSILTGLLKNEEKFGYRYCPCRRKTGDIEQDKKIICPCIYHEDEVRDDGQCKCFLFVKKD
ncbi:ferredoxin:thioredoxin reductase [Candidatus Woesearchaeota archaeon]|nr:ferredoxin:thioredoxin reductase [Candidatus Woesearchaeota archaeon]